jgi:hypothetical protein
VLQVAVSALEFMMIVNCWEKVCLAGVELSVIVSVIP